MNIGADGACAACTQAQLQLEDLQQSGVERLDLGEAESAVATGALPLTPVACR